MEYQKYEKYKNSGIDWLGEIPFNWSIWKVSHGFSLIGSGTTPDTEDSEYYDGDIPWVTTSELRENVILDTKVKVTEKAILELSALKKYKPNTLLIAMYGATIGRLGILGIEATVNQACCAFDQPRSFASKFVFYWLYMAKPILISLSSGGGQPNLNQDTLKRLRIPVPSIQEQKAIADFLDKEVSRIDILIGKKQQFIERLKEKRLAVISNAVTKGINSNAELKPSGVEWLGDMPKNWEVKKLKYAVNKVGSGITPSGGATSYLEEGIPLIRSQNVYSDGLRLTDVVYIDRETHVSMSNSKVQANDVLLNITGASLGRCYFTDNPFSEANVNQHVCIIRPALSKLSPKFLHLLLISDAGQNQIWNNQTGSGREGLNFEAIKNFVFAFPKDVEEQEQIVRIVEYETSKIDSLIDKSRLAIDILKEYKTALISAAVTGKIKVINPA